MLRNFEISAKWLAFSHAPSVSAVSFRSAYRHIHYVAAESANLDADGTVECHFSLEEFPAPPPHRSPSRGPAGAVMFACFS